MITIVPALGGGSDVLIRFEVRAGGTNGFVPGQLCVGAHENQECFESMVALSATLLLDQLAAWSPSVPILTFIPVDCGEHIEFRRGRWHVEVWARGHCVAETTEADLRASAIRACAELFESYVAKLAITDAGRQDLEGCVGGCAAR